MVKKYLLSTFSLSKNCTHASFTEPCDIGFFPTFYNKTEVIHTNVANIDFFFKSMTSYAHCVNYLQ